LGTKTTRNKPKQKKNKKRKQYKQGVKCVWFFLLSVKKNLGVKLKNKNIFLSSATNIKKQNKKKKEKERKKRIDIFFLFFSSISTFFCNSTR